MERKKAPPSGKIRWRKKGGGSFRMADGRIIKPNQVFSAKPEEIPKGFRDIVVPLDKEELKKAEIEAVTKTAKTVRFELQKTLTGEYNVVNMTTGKAMNSTPLNEDKANLLLMSLNS